MLRLEHVDAGYGDVQVLWDVSIHVDNQEFVVLVGANGAGKSTIMKSISSLLQPSRGEIWFEETRLDKVAPYRISDLGIAHVPEGRQLFPEMTVRENLEMGSLPAAAKAHRQETLEW
ncbi:MAG: ATP-binding cassette domain-containing protein, partial [Desulforhabdus sp.]|nr:ATP-binding cassette domain-containing protein [Desulforhabdus sp.]